MRKIKFICVVAISFMLIACGKSEQSEVPDAESKTEKTEAKVTNEQFFGDLIIGLQNRWKISNTLTRDTSELETRNLYMEALQQEVDAVSKYKDKVFEDSQLGELAKKYISALEKQKQASEYEDDSEKYNEYWSQGYEARMEYLKAMNTEYGLYKIGDDSFREELQSMIEVFQPIDVDEITNLDWEGLYTTTYANIKNYAFYISTIDTQSKSGTVTMYSAVDDAPDSAPVKATVLDDNRLYFEYVDEAHSTDDNYTVKFILSKTADTTTPYTLTLVWTNMNESTDTNVYDLVNSFDNNELDKVGMNRQ